MTKGKEGTRCNSLFKKNPLDSWFVFDMEGLGKTTQSLDHHPPEKYFLFIDLEKILNQTHKYQWLTSDTLLGDLSHTPKS